MGLERCGFCTAPIYLRIAAAWNDDGTITGRYAPSTRVVQLYDSEINHILSGISGRIGHDIGRIVVEGERKAAIQFNRDLMERWRGPTRALMHSRLFYRPLNLLLLRAARSAGLGSGRILHYRWGDEIEIEFSSPFNIPILAGDMLGTFEAFFSKPAEVTWEGDSRRAVITISTAGGASHVEEQRLKPLLPPTRPGGVSFDRCPRCGIPLEVTRRYRFDLDDGVATEVKGGRRIVTVIIDSLLSVFEELEGELGEDIPRMIVDLEGDFIKENAERAGGPGDAHLVEGLLGDLTVKGMGNPVGISVSADGILEVRIDNPFSRELLAGRVLGYYRMLWGDPARVEWTPDTEGFMVIKVRRSE